MSFRKIFKTRVAIVIDCFEVFTEKPANLLARYQRFSTYKHHNTAKFLIGICPQGVISFISKAWGGRVSNKHLTEHCGILNYLLPKDIIRADRGFDIQDSAALYYAEETQHFPEARSNYTLWRWRKPEKLHLFGFMWSVSLV